MAEEDAAHAEAWDHEDVGYNQLWDTIIHRHISFEADDDQSETPVTDCLAPRNIV